jgi:hypothetical protein
VYSHTPIDVSNWIKQGSVDVGNFEGQTIGLVNNFN